MEFQSFSPEHRLEVAIKDLDLSILEEELELAPRFVKVRLELKEKEKVEALKRRQEGLQAEEGRRSGSKSWSDIAKSLCPVCTGRTQGWSSEAWGRTQSDVHLRMEVKLFTSKCVLYGIDSFSTESA